MYQGRQYKTIKRVQRKFKSITIFTNKSIKKVIDSNNGKKVFLIVDNIRVHHAKLVKAWEEENKDKIKIFYITAYSPDYNPDEYLNQDYKQRANKYELPTSQKQLRTNTEKYMLSLQQNPQKVANFFKHPKVQYAS